MSIAEIAAFKAANRFIAARRDNCTCPMCGEPATDSDHVFGRGTKVKEHWMLLMSLCRKCHDQKHHGSGFNIVEQVKVLGEKNDFFYSNEDDYDTVMLAIDRGLHDLILKMDFTAETFIENWIERND